MEFLVLVENTDKESMNDSSKASACAVHAGIQVGGGSAGGCRPGHCSGGQSLGYPQGQSGQLGSPGSQRGIEWGRGRAFGFHRAADTLGAVVGPLLGVAIRGWVQRWQWNDASGPFRFVLWLSIIPGVLAVLAFLTLVKDPEHSPNPALKFFSSLRGLPTRFKRYLGAVGIFGIGDFSHSLLILVATTLLTASMGVMHAAQVAGLLYVWRNVVQVAVSYPVGVLADRVGHLTVLLAGIFFVAGLYVAVQEALESTVTAQRVQPNTLAMSYGVLGTVNGAAKFISSATVGVVWTAVSPVLGFGLAAGMVAAGTAALLRVRNG